MIRLKKWQGAMASVVLAAWTGAVCADYVAYSVNSTGKKKPLPENIDGINATDLVNIDWGQYSGSKARVAVLEVNNESPAQVMRVNSSRTGTVEFDPRSKAIPIQGLEAILMDALHRSGRFRVVERTVLDKQLQEQDFGASGRVSAPSAAETGKVLGAQYQIQAVVTSYEPETEGQNLGIGSLLSGQAKELLGGLGVKSSKSTIGMNFRLIDTATSEIAFSKQVESVISKTGLSFGGFGQVKDDALGGFLSSYSKTPIGQAAIAAINKGVYELIKQIGSAPTRGSVVKAGADGVYINLGSSVVAVGDKFELQAVGEKLVDPETGLDLGAEEQTIGELEVRKVTEKYSIAAPVNLDPNYAIKKGDRVTRAAKRASMEFGSPWTHAASE